ELVKDLENIKGDLIQNYKTIPVVYGEKSSKIIISLFTLLSFVPAYLLIAKYEVGHMYLFFYACVFLLLIFLFILWKSSTKTHYVILHNILKFIILSGVLSILLIDLDLVLHRIG